MRKLIYLDELNRFPIRLDHYDEENGDIRYIFGVEAVIEYANSLPAVEATPVRHGYWKETDDPMFRACSVCGYLEWWGLWNNYCPECGAKMDGGTVDETD